MATYVTLYSWTEQGIKNFRDTTDRAKSAIAQAEKMGGKITQLLWTSGEYDLVGIAEFPDDQSMSAFSLALASLGNVRTTTMRAYNEREMAAIIAKAR
ncbi:MAG: GYD domain-containing protein [Chloroflexi bacterium]|nr:MAG: GYD domain-containing protein [Chloroflexota bacterium]